MVLKFNAHLVKCRLKYGLCNPPLMSPAKMPKNGNLLNKKETLMSKVLICSIKNLNVHLQQK